MPRQPITKVLPNGQYGDVAFGKVSTDLRPKLVYLVGKCLMLWPYVESRMALILGQLLGGKNAAAVAVFQLLRRSSAQREAISVAANFVLNPTDRELLSAILNVHKSIESDRNALAHGHFGISNKLPDALLWIDTSAFIALKSSHKLTRHNLETQKNLIDAVYVYNTDDLARIFNDLSALNLIWVDFLSYLQQDEPQLRAPKYHQLCDQSRIAQELVTLRQKNSPSTQN